MKTTDSTRMYARRTLGPWLAMSAFSASVFTAQVSMADAMPEQEAVGPQGAQLQGAQLQGAQLQGAQLQGPIVSSGLAAANLVATLSDGTPIEVLSFHGDLVEVSVGAPVDPASTIMDAQDLVGMTWYAPICSATECVDSWYRISGGARDTSSNTMPHHGSNNDIWMYQIDFTLDTASGIWEPVCGAGNPGMFVSGTWDENGDLIPAGYTFSCTDGVIAKCSRGWGYKPWMSLAAHDGSLVDLQPLHYACTRAARADYCGDGTAHTVEGLLIDIFDVHGFNVNEHMRGFSEEASFDEYGAVSFKHHRVLDHPAPMTCRGSLPRHPPANETPLLWVWSRPTVTR